MLRNLLTVCVAAASSCVAFAQPAKDLPDGAKIYEAKCASCHGKSGEGTKKYKTPLGGDRSVAQLTTLIQKTMPEDNPESLSDKDAAAVSNYVYETMYSKLARERNRPARVELARLTVKQYRQSVTDLINSFRWTPNLGTERGLKGGYFAARGFRQDKRVLERVDPQVAFNWGVEPAVKEKMEANEFSVAWTGALLAPQTGDYEFVVRTEHATKFFLNDNQKPLIDAWVKSGSDTEFKGSITLVAGRAYPLRLEFSKAKQGVDDSKNQKKTPPPKPASMTLLWKRPNGTLEVIAQRFLAPVNVPELFVSTASFPPDDRSYGWERGTAVSKEWDSATTEAALEVAAFVAEKIDSLAGTKDGAADRITKIKQFSRLFAERAFRRPLSPELVALLVEKPFAAKEDLELTVKKTVLRVLKSPMFLYREVSGGPDAFDTAARLSYGLWDSLPDQELWNAAARGELKTREQIVRQTERMLNDPRAKLKLRDFLLTWLKADLPVDLTKDAKKYPDFDASTIADLKTSLELFLDDVLESDGSDFRKLVKSPEIYVNERLAKFYKVKAPANVSSGFVKVQPDEHRAGVLTHPYLMAGFAHSAESSPIHRGVFIARGILGVSLKPPAEAIAPLAPDLHPSLTTRERINLQTKAAACMTCHTIINPLGFTLENFDAVGRYRDSERNKPIDASGSFAPREGKPVTLKNARELGNFVADSPDAQTAFAEQLFHYFVQQPVRAYGPTTMATLTAAFRKENFHIKKLAVEAMAIGALKGR